MLQAMNLTKRFDDLVCCGSLLMQRLKSGSVFRSYWNQWSWAKSTFLYVLTAESLKQMKGHADHRWRRSFRKIKSKEEVFSISRMMLIFSAVMLRLLI